VLKRHFASPVLVRAMSSRRVSDGFETAIDVVLCGRTATAHAVLIHETMDALSRAGVGPRNHRVAIQITEGQVFFEGELRGFGGSEPQNHDGLLLELVTPTGSDPSRISATRTERFLTEFEAGVGLPLGYLLGNVAEDLVQWDLEDRGLSATYGRRPCEDLAEEARQAAQEAAKRIVITSSALFESSDIMKARSNTSRTGNGMHPLLGQSGHVMLSGDLPAVWPWLLGAAVRGFAQQRSKGFGHVRLWRTRP
jgi:hypothetical protein